MTSSEIRQSFLDFFEEKKHTIVPSASLMPTSPNLLFTNAGMNQFIPYFLGSEAAPYDPPRAADTQKCIRAGGKHNDLEDVGYDTYHHTLFEMLGNWSFGNYFKEEAITWAWELLTERWKLPAERLYATVYAPSEGDPAEFDQEAYDLWAAIFEKAGLDPKIHIVNGNKKDNFWMMGETGPCGPCSELHIDLTPEGDTKGSLVNADDSRCIEIWNLVFIQFNANEDGTFRPLPATHVDTGMGFERVCSIIQCTKGLSDFSTLASNYDTDVFSPIFDKLSALTGKKYTSTVPENGKRAGLSEQEQIDIAFRVIGDHIRTTSFAIADGIEPGNGGRNYVIRNILRRAVRFGRILGFDAKSAFLHQLVPVLVEQMGEVFPELATRQEKIKAVLLAEEEQFNRTLDRGLKLFNDAADKVASGENFPAATVVKLWETFGFPTDLTQLLLDERSITADEKEVERLVEAHKNTGSEGQTTSVVEAVSIETNVVTEFVGFEQDETEANIVEWIENDSGIFAIVDKSPFYIEKGGQQGDIGELIDDGESIPVLSVVGVGEATVLQLEKRSSSDTVTLKVNTDRRRGIEKHHTATHLFHWALHEVVDPDATQQGSLVAPDRLRFDFNSKALTTDQLSEIESKVNQCISDDSSVAISEVPQAAIKDNPKIMQFFGDKYGDLVRVVQIGGEAGKFDGYSMELCGGTHVPATGSIGFFKVKSEGAVAAGIRRIEAVCGSSAAELIQDQAEAVSSEVTEATAKLEAANQKLKSLGKEEVVVDSAGHLAEEITTSLQKDELASANTSLINYESYRDTLKSAAVDAEKSVKKASAGAAAAIASQWYEDTLASLEGNTYAGLLPGDSPALLQEAMNVIKARQFSGAVALALVADGTVHLGSVVSKDATDQYKAGDIVRESLAVANGKGGGKPEMARGAAPNAADQVEAILTKAAELLS
ncbi:alanine--tRNA ligase [Verrucomicrobiales bacterium]|jgi:alanyl-tRNA synthetase|nr:alanine--tRNA ligase [Verrucomicrobiales bacterium]